MPGGPPAYPDCLAVAWRGHGHSDKKTSCDSVSDCKEKALMWLLSLPHEQVWGGYLRKRGGT